MVYNSHFGRPGKQVDTIHRFQDIAALGKPYPVTVEGGFSKPIKCKTDRKFADTVREVLQAEHTVALLRSVLARYS